MLHHLKIQQNGDSPASADVWLDGRIIHPTLVQLDFDVDSKVTTATITLNVRVDVDVLTSVSAADPMCRVMVTRACPVPSVYVCAGRECARFELTQEQADPIWDASDALDRTAASDDR